MRVISIAAGIAVGKGYEDSSNGNAQAGHDQFQLHDAAGNGKHLVIEKWLEKEGRDQY